NSLHNAKLPETGRMAIAAAIEAQLRPSMADLGIDSEKVLREATLKTGVKLIDLNGDGIPEVVAQAMADCSPTGNCSFFFQAEDGIRYRLILNGFGQTF